VSYNGQFYVNFTLIKKPQETHSLEFKANVAIRKSE
jgi:hypothetical protein